MSIAEKLTTIVENVPKVYQAGYEKGKSEGGNIAETYYTYATSLYEHFRNAVFSDGCELTLDIPNVTSLYNTFYGAKGITKVTLKGNVSGIALNCQNTFSATAVTEVDFSEFNLKPTSMQNFCLNSKQLVVLNGVIDMSSCTKVSSAFASCTALEEVRFAKETIKLSISFAQSSMLSAESVQSIIDGLATVETEQTLTLNSAVSSALTEEQWSEILNKNWMVQ